MAFILVKINENEKINFVFTTIITIILNSHSKRIFILVHESILT